MNEEKELNNYEKSYLQYSKMWALSHGLIHQPLDLVPNFCTFLPYCLYPTPVPRKLYEKAFNLQTIFNELYHRVATDREFLRSTLSTCIEEDDFIRNLWKIFEKTDNNTLYRLGIFRNDFMFTKSKDNQLLLKQVEFNTISVAFIALSDIVAKLHNNHQENAKSVGLAFRSAWQLYNNPKAIVVFVILPNESNIADHCLLEDAIKKHEEIPKVRRLTLGEIGSRGVVDETQRLWIDGEEIAVVYFRAGYDPKHYPTDLEWRGRTLVELSVTVKSPSIDYQLAGCKRIQAELCKPEVLKGFINDIQQIEEICDTFMPMFALDDDFERVKSIILSDPSKWILKPQREGGGNNVYGNDILNFMKTTSEKQLRSFVAMERIKPYTSKNIIVKPSECFWSSVINELGIFGFVLSKHQNIIENKAFGSLLRTKHINTEEGGVAAGASALDSVKLYDCM